MKPVCFVLALCLTGCSFFFVKGPSDESRPPRAYPSCTRSMTYPVVDGVLSALFIFGMAAAIAEDDNSSTSFDDDEASRAEKITSSAVLAAVTGVSAYLGYSRVSRCRGAHESFQAAYPNGVAPAGAYPYGYAQQPYYPQQPQQPPPYPGTTQPAAAPPPYPGTQPVTQPAATPPPPPAKSTQPAATALGTEGDVCSSNAECGTGLACTNNVCMRPPATK
jgi:hypothetical protein